MHCDDNPPEIQNLYGAVGSALRNLIGANV